jgi:aldehyde:ferredoxin oxidoreductase
MNLIIKAVVVKGAKAPVAADPEKIVQLNRIMGEKCKTHPNRKWGTEGNMLAFEASGNLPIRNFAGEYSRAWKRSLRPN